MRVRALLILAGALLLSITGLCQSCAAGFVQQGSTALVGPNCVSISQAFNVVNRNISSGNFSGTLVTSAVNGMYGIRVEAVPDTVGVLGTMIVTINWVQNGSTYSVAMATLSLAALTNVLSAYTPIYPDAGTAITYSVAVAGTGTFDLHIDGRPPSV